MARTFYVYSLSKPTGEVFYIGKGTGRRIEDHEKEAAAGYTTAKCKTIRSIWDSGQKVVYNTLFTTTDEKAAYDEEIQQIKLHGREFLTNRQNGGGCARAAPNITEFVSVKIRQDTLRLLRLVAALRDETHYEAIDSALKAELKRIEEESETRV